MKNLADVPISVLDLVPIREGGTASQAFRTQVAELATELGESVKPEKRGLFGRKKS